ncbi:hypothetical protein KJ644_04360 [Candidatus Dependentiae bacterium]|nr:hypothetical protein [Candidatus Dependentiae bacterium]MBU4387672.1 hypothetical protein [Candidatus Dependentiae bacterium]MCG2756059.1 hypothetical protein [Candidatus Dependentiae bacterium]
MKKIIFSFLFIFSAITNLNSMNNPNETATDILTKYLENYLYLNNTNPIDGIVDIKMRNLSDTFRMEEDGIKIHFAIQAATKLIATLVTEHFDTMKNIETRTKTLKNTANNLRKLAKYLDKKLEQPEKKETEN